MRPTLRNPGILLSGALLALLCACGSGSKSSSSAAQASNTAPSAGTPVVSPAGASLTQYKTYTFTATASDPDIGDSVASCVWDFGDGTPTVTVLSSTSATFQTTHVFMTPSASDTVTVTPKDSHGLVGSSGIAHYLVNAAPNPFANTVKSPTAAYTQNISQGSTATVTFSFYVNYTGTSTVDPTKLVFTPGNALATAPAVVTAGTLDGVTPWIVTQAYPASGAVGTTYTATPSLTLVDNLSVQSAVLTFPTITFQTVVANPTPPTVVITAPQSASTNLFALQTATLNFSVTDAALFPTTVTVNWGDSTAPDVVVLSGAALATGMSPASPLTHQYTSAQTFTVTVTAVDTQATNNTATAQPITFKVAANALPTATITTPQASGTLPTLANVNTFTPASMSGEMTIPVAAKYPQLVVIPMGGKLHFNGTITNPGSGETATPLWSFPGGSPGTSTDLDAGNVIFAGVANKIVAYLVELKSVDVFGRNSSQVGQGLTGVPAMAANGQNTTPFRKWVIVDGTASQSFYLNFLYRQLNDTLRTPNTLSPVLTSDNGLGATVQIFQDGVSNDYVVQSGNQASVIIPVRSSLPFWINIPAFGADGLGYMLQIPNAPTGPFADPALVAAGATLPSGAATFSFANAAAPFNPTLNLVTAQGFDLEAKPPTTMYLEGSFSLAGSDPSVPPKTNRWTNLLSIPATDPIAAPKMYDNNTVGSLPEILVYQSIPEWIVFLKTMEPDLLPLATIADTDSTAEGQPADLGFNLLYASYAPPTAKSKTVAATEMQAFRVPPSAVDPYNLSTGVTSWNASSCSVALVPRQVAAQSAMPTFFHTMLYTGPGATPLSGGLDNLTIPYDTNDPNRKVLTSPLVRNMAHRVYSTFTTSEYLWSAAWVRPLVLNTANLSTTDLVDIPNPPAPALPQGPQFFNFYRYSSTATWPKMTAAPGITPDLSTFDITANGGGVFDAGSPVGTVGGTAPDTKAVGRFWWTAYTPSYNAPSGACIARTWLADATGLVPTTFAGTATDANNALGFVPPQDPIVDKRGRDANGNLLGSGAMGGFRLTWFNPTKAADGKTCVPPDFWAIEITTNGKTTHFLLPPSFPAAPTSGVDATQTTGSPILTDARYYLPSGVAATGTPGANDTVAPGYCWFDVPPEVRPATGGDAQIIIFALKSVMANHAPAGAYPRPLNRTDWIDAIKTASATIKIDSNAGKDLSYAYKVPFNFGWDIVVTNCEPTLVAF